MTNEEKARAYDEALEDMMAIYPNLNGDAKLAIEHAFPQLAESEDERIRKELLEEIESIIPHEDETDSEGLILPLYHTRIDRYKSYLEKQKDLDKMIVVSPEVWDKAISDAFKNGKKEGKKHKEQKPADEAEKFFDSVESYNQGFVAGQKKMKEDIEKGFGISEHSLDYLTGRYAGYSAARQEQKSNVLQNAFDKSKKDYTLEEKSKASDYAESILPTSIMYGESEEEYKLHTIIEAAFIAGQKEQKPEVKYVYPKFRVGDEIVEVTPNGYCPPVVVKYIGEGSYSCESKDGKRFLSFPIKRENEYRLVEQKPNIELIQRSWYREGYNDRTFGKEPKWVIKTGDGGPKYEENPKYGQMLEAEQKPVEVDEYKIIKKHITEDVLSSEVNKRLKECGWYVTDEKPADWSEEDEATLNWCISDIERAKHSASQTKPEICDIEINWLKSLKPRLKQEWSEKDEIMIGSLINYFEGDALDCSLDCVINWLKSIRPQPKQNDMITPNKKFFQWIYDRLVNVHNEDPNMDYMISFKKRIEESSWKPSEEQMLYLLAVINEPNNAGSESCHLVLKELYEQLKTL